MKNVKISVPKNGVFSVIETDTGEVVHAIPVDRGMHDAAPLLDLVGFGQGYALPDGASFVYPPLRSGLQEHPEATQSGANPDYQPTSADKFERMMRQTMRKLQAEQRVLDARLKALDGVEKMPRNKAQADPDPVVESPAAGDAEADAKPKAKADLGQ